MRCCIDLEQHPDFETVIRNDPIELLAAVEQLMHNPVRARYSHVTLTDALVHVTSLRQQEHENLMDCVKWFKQQRDVLESVAGKKILDEFVERTKEHRDETDATKQQVMKDEAFERWCACLLVCNADQAKCGSLIRGLVSQFSMGNDQCPAAIVAAADVLSNHWFDNCKTKNDRNRNDQN